MQSGTAALNNNCSPVDDNTIPADLLELLPSDVVLHLLACAGGPAALQQSRAASTAWKAALDNLVVSAACSILPRSPSCSPCSALQVLPRLATVDFSSCCEPLPAGKLASVLQELATLPQLTCLKLSTWCLAQQLQQQQQQQQGQTEQQQPAAGSANALNHCCYDVVMPQELGLITGLQQLVIGNCAEVSAPAARRAELTPAVMRLKRLTRLELHGFLPFVHHLRGMQHLQHLLLNVQVAAAGAAALTTTTTAGAGGSSWLDQNRYAVQAAMVTVSSSKKGLSSLHVHLSAPPNNNSAVLADCGAGALLSLLCEGYAGDSIDATADGNGQASADSASSCSADASSTDPADAEGRPGHVSCRLQQLSLTSAGALCHIPAKLAVVCAGLQHLDLSRSFLSSEAAAVLGGLSHLTSLSLAECDLTAVPRAWAPLQRLQVLNLSSNNLRVLPAFFSELQALVKLVLSSTHLLALPNYISSLTCLEHMELASNKLQDIPAELCSCVNLRHLDVSKNRLLTLPEHFSSLSRITQLNLTGNHLEAMPSGLDNLPNLSQLGLALNYYKTWRHAAPCFASLASSLQELELQHTASVLDDSAGFLAAVGQLTALTSLCAGSNQLSDLPEEWKQLKQLKVLQLSHNAMEVLPISLLSLTALTYLDLSYNRLMLLPFWIGSTKLQQLRRLNLAKNHLTTLPAELAGLSKLTQLQLQGNNLACLPICLGELLQLRLLNIGGNYKLKEGGLGQQLAAIPSLRDVVLPYRLGDVAAELRRAGKAVVLD